MPASYSLQEYSILKILYTVISHCNSVATWLRRWIYSTEDKSRPEEGGCGLRGLSLHD